MEHFYRAFESRLTRAFTVSKHRLKGQMSLPRFEPSGNMASTFRHTDVEATSSRRIDVNMKSFRRFMPAGKP